MCRELKFRAWSLGNRLEGKDPHYIDDFAIDAFYGTPVDIFDGNGSDDGIECIEQYTGLKDKNGKEIYEGDIIHRGALPKVNVFRNSVIRFDEESVGFIATSTRNGARTLFNGHTCDEIEVIGNIHENPELLGGENEDN